MLCLKKLKSSYFDVFYLPNNKLLKPSQNKKLPAVKKDTIFGAARKNFGPSYFMKTLINGRL